MGLNPSKGNMYDFVTHTWNTVKGICPHGCAYCYMHRFNNQKPVRFDAKELKTDLGEDNFIFVGSSCDLFAGSIPCHWTDNTLEHCRKFDNRYLFQSKNPRSMARCFLPEGAVVCTTIETNRWYPKIMGTTPYPEDRAEGMAIFDSFSRYVTIEPIIDFDIEPLIELIKRCEPEQVNIGADSGGNGLPEPDSGKILSLIEGLGKFTKIARKNNLARLLK
jgi:DNA repair photolyase